MGDGHVDRWMALITANGKLSLLLSIAFKQLTKLQQNEIKIKESPLMNLDLETVDIFVHCFQHIFLTDQCPGSWL